MRKYEFLYKLEKALSSMDESDRNAAMRYYEEYFEDAGAENEQKVINELGDPEELAKTIMNDGDDSCCRKSERNCSCGGEHCGSIVDMNLPAFKSIKGKTVNSALRIERGDAYGIEWSCDNPTTTFEYHIGADTLYYEEKISAKKIFNINFGDCDGGRLTIYLPDEAFDDIDVKNVNGSMKIERLKASSLTAGTVNGSVTVSAPRVKRLTLDSVNGSVSGDEIAADEVKVKTVNGSVRVEGTFDGNVNMSTVNGSIRIATMLGEKEYNYKLSTWGSIRINDKKVGLDNLIGRGDASINNGAPREMNISAVHGSVKIATAQ